MSASQPELPRSPLPWDGKPERADVVILVGIALYGVYGLALWPVVPLLIGSHPLVLELVSGSTLAEVTLGALSRVGQASWVVALLAGLPSSMAFDWVFWWAGRRWGDRSLHLLMGRGGRVDSVRQDNRATRLERRARRFGPAGVVLAYYLPVPSVLVYAAAGLAGMRLRTFLLLDAIGTLLWIGLVVGLGYAIGQRAVDVVKRIDHYSLWITIGLVLVVVVVATLRSRRR